MGQMVDNQLEDVQQAYERACDIIERVNSFFNLPMGITIIGSAVMLCYSIFASFMIIPFDMYGLGYVLETSSLLAGYLITSALLNQSVSLL